MGHPDRQIDQIEGDQLADVLGDRPAQLDIGAQTRSRGNGLEADGQRQSQAKFVTIEIRQHGDAGARRLMVEFGCPRAAG